MDNAYGRDTVTLLHYLISRYSLLAITYSLLHRWLYAQLQSEFVGYGLEEFDLRLGAGVSHQEPSSADVLLRGSYDRQKRETCKLYR